MAMFTRKTPEEIEAETEARARRRAGEASARERRRVETMGRRAQAAREAERAAFDASPEGRSRAAFERGDRVFQCSMDVATQLAVSGEGTKETPHDANPALNGICAQGWELVGGSFVFVEEGHQGLDRFMSSGQHPTVRGRTVGYYLFKRAEKHRTATRAPGAPFVDIVVVEPVPDPIVDAVLVEPLPDPIMDAVIVDPGPGTGTHRA